LPVGSLPTSVTCPLRSIASAGCTALVAVRQQASKTDVIGTVRTKEAIDAVRLVNALMRFVR
jgi:hypothetical protein